MTARKEISWMEPRALSKARAKQEVKNLVNVFSRRRVMAISTVLLAAIFLLMPSLGIELDWTLKLKMIFAVIMAAHLDWIAYFATLVLPTFVNINRNGIFVHGGCSFQLRPGDVATIKLEPALEPLPTITIETSASKRFTVGLANRTDTQELISALREWFPKASIAAA